MPSESVLLATSVLVVGVKVPVQVMLSLLAIDGSDPLGFVMLAAAKSLTASEKPSVTVAVSPIVSNASSIVKLSTLGASVSTMNLLLDDTALCVRVALLPAGSLIVPLFKARALALMLMPSVSLSPAWIVYLKTLVVLPLPEEV